VQVVAFQHDLVNITPAPVFARLDRTHEGVVGGMEVLGGVLILGRIAAAHVSAGKAETKMNPGVAQLEAFFAAFRFGVDRLDVLTVIAVGHGLCLFCD
jgi:hypothetical protein